MNIACHRSTDALPDLAAGTLPEGDVLRLRAHLSECAACAAEWDLVQSVRALPLDTPIGLGARVEAALTTPARRRPRRYAAVAAVLATALVGGVIAVQLLDTSPSPVATTSTFPVLQDPLVRGGSVLSELSEAELEVLLTEMES